MRDTVDSIKEYGVLVPAIVRPCEDGGYEIVSGHRRKYASELAGLDTMPVIVRNLDRDAATIVMVDSNLQRENILPSERAGELAEKTPAADAALKIEYHIRDKLHFSLSLFSLGGKLENQKKESYTRRSKLPGLHRIHTSWRLHCSGVHHLSGASGSRCGRV